ncbi:MAG: oxidoreductase [Acidobacteria bacterium]|nr:MAG: oxidoreductase [Acidobacteriota bacterium]
MDNVINFGGMTALITGASSGIGAASATAFGTRGARVLIHYNRQESEAQRILERVRGAGGQGELLRADLTTMDGVRSLVRALAGRRIDILVNNAGSLIQRTPVLNFTEELWEQVLTLNLTSAFFLAKAVLAGMVERKSGFVVNVSSVAARNGGGLGALAYASAKGALSTMTMGLAKEFAPFGIRVNAVSPGTIDTKYHRNFSNDQILNAVKAATPMARLGTAEEVADVILFLCSHEARFIQGQVIEVNGGFS